MRKRRLLHEPQARGLREPPVDFRIHLDAPIVPLDFGSYYNKFLHANYTPEEGKMLIWPNYVMHGSYPYEGNEDRIIVSANAQVSIMENGKPIKSL